MYLTYWSSNGGFWFRFRKHLYSNHLEQAQEQLTRTPKAAPQLRLNPEVNDLFAFRFEDIHIDAYEAHPHIKAEVAV